MGYTWEMELKIYKVTILLMIIAGIIMAVFFKDPLSFILGLIFGTLISILNFRSLALTLERAVTMPPEKAQIYAGSRYFIRFAINAMVIFISIKADYLHVLGAVIGLLIIKFVIVITNLFNNTTFYKRIFIRKEEK